MERQVGADISDRARKSDKTTVYITPDVTKELERLAKKMGYLQTRGAGTGELGNVSALLRAIAVKEVTVERAVGPESEGAQDEGE